MQSQLVTSLRSRLTSAEPRPRTRRTPKIGVTGTRLRDPMRQETFALTAAAATFEMSQRDFRMLLLE